MKNVKITRRSFLLGLGAASSALLLSACGSTDAPASSASTSALPQPDSGAPASSAASEVPLEPILRVDEFPITDGSTACIPLIAQIMADTTGLDLETARSAVTTNTTAQAWRNLGLYGNNYGDSVKLLICADAAAGALLEARLENLPGAEKVFDFGAVSYANPKTGPLIEKRARARLPKDCTDPLRQALARAQAARRVVGADLSAACAERESDCVLVLSCRKGCFLRTVPAGENPALWLLDIIRRTAANKPQAEGTGSLPARRSGKKDVLPSPQPKRHPLRRVCMTLLVLALLAALAAVGAWKYTNGNFYALPEQLRALLTEHIPRPGATLV